MVSHLKGNQHKAAIKEINKKITEAEMVCFVFVLFILECIYHSRKGNERLYLFSFNYVQ